MASLGTAYIKIAPDLTGVQGKISRQLNQDGVDSSESFGKGFSSNLGPIMGGAAKIGFAAVGATAVAAGALIAKNFDNAIARVDTLVAFPRVLQAMGATAEQAAKSTSTLSTKLEGLPTPLQEGASGVQKLVAAGLGVEDATNVFLAFNNATLAASTEAGAAQGAFVQLTQSISKGKIEGQEWNSLVAAMPTAFKALANSSGKTREELRELYRTNPQKLLDDLVKLDKEGGGGMQSLEKQARAATGGTKSAFANMNTAIASGLEGIVKKIGDGDLEAGQKKISAAVENVGKAFKTGLGKAGDFFVFIARNKDVFLPIVAGIGTFIAISTVLVASLKAIAVAQGFLGAVMNTNVFVLAATVIASLAVALVVLEKRTGVISSAFKGMTDSARPFANYIKDTVLPNLQSFASFIGGQLAGAWRDFSSAIKRVYDTIKPAIPTFVRIGAVLTALPIAASIATFTGLVGALSLLVAVVSRVVGWLAQFGSKVYETQVAVGTWAEQSISRLPIIGGAYDALKDKVSGVFNAIKNVVSSYAGAMTAETNVKTKVDEHKRAVDDSARALRDYKTAQDIASSAQLAATGSALGVERAQKTYNDTVKQYGPTSLEAREAEYQLKVAKENNKKATEASTKATGEAKDKSGEYRSSLENEASASDRAARATQDAQNKTSSWTHVKGNIMSFFSSSGNWLYSSGQSIMSGLERGIQSMAGSVSGTAQSVMTRLRGLFPSSPAKYGPFSGRGYTTYSGSKLMQDFGRGIVGGSNGVISQASNAMGSIRGAMGVGANSMSGSFSPSSAASASNNEYNIGTVNISNEVDGERWLRKLTGNQEITSARLTPKQAYM